MEVFFIMINIRLICVGKIKENYLKEAILEYKKRLSKYANLEIIEVKDEKVSENPSLKEIEIIKDKEFENIKKYISSVDFLLIFDLKGKEFDSISYAKYLNNIMINNSKITFLIGGSYGISEKINTFKNEKIKLSSLTFPHQLCRVIVLESLYRCFKIINNETYHK